MRILYLRRNHRISIPTHLRNQDIFLEGSGDSFIGCVMRIFHQIRHPHVPMRRRYVFYWHRVSFFVYAPPLSNLSETISVTNKRNIDKIHRESYTKKEIQRYENPRWYPISSDRKDEISRSNNSPMRYQQTSITSVGFVPGLAFDNV
jgi:hypothetical protein